MSARKPLIYLAVFILLGLVYYFVEHRGGEARRQAGELANKALVFPADSVEFFCLVGGGGADSVALLRSGTGWRIVFPLDAPADSASVARLLRSAADARIDRVVEDSAADLTVFGLDSPTVSLALRTVNADSVLRLYLGGKNPTGSYVYAAEGSRPRRVVLLNSWIEGDLKKSAPELRDKKILHFRSADIGRLTLRRGAETALSLRRPENGGWIIETPYGAPADPDSVRNLLQAFEDAVALDFVDTLSAAGPAALGLAEPGLTLVLSDEQGGASHTLYVGSRTVTGDYHARREGMDNVYVLAAHLVERLSGDLSRFRDRALVRALRDRIDSLTLTRPGETVCLVKDEDGAWKIVHPRGARADGARVDGLLWDLKDLRAARFVDTPGDALESAFSRPSLSVELGVDGVVTRLDFARLSPRDSLAYVRVSDLHGAAALDSSAPGRLSLGFDDLVSRRALDFDAAAVDRVRLEYPDRTIEMVKEGESWSLTEPVRAPARGWKAQNILWDLESLDFRSVVSESGSDSLAYGFGEPSLRLALLKGDSLAASAAFGGACDGDREVYLRVAGDSRTFAVDRRALEGLPSDEAELKQEDDPSGGN